MNKAIVVLDKNVVSALWAKIIRVIITENVPDLELWFLNKFYIQGVGTIQIGVMINLL